MKFDGKRFGALVNQWYMTGKNLLPKLASLTATKRSFTCSNALLFYQNSSLLFNSLKLSFTLL